MIRALRLAAVAALLAVSATPLSAQTPTAKKGSAEVPPSEAAPAAPAPPAPYEGPLLRLSELMGSLHYLRGLCGAPDAPDWRHSMTALLDSEAGDENRKSRLAGAFNRGYRTFQQTYHSCNASAQATIRAYLEEGRQIARDIGARYAG